MFHICSACVHWTSATGRWQPLHAAFSKRDEALTCIDTIQTRPSKMKQAKQAGESCRHVQHMRISSFGWFRPPSQRARRDVHGVVVLNAHFTTAQARRVHAPALVELEGVLRGDG